MFSLQGSQFVSDCQTRSRREFLRVGSLALGGLTLPGLLASRARAAGRNPSLSGKSVVLLFLQGGPSHIEFFDPKMTAPAEIRSVTGEVATTHPGITFGGTFPKLAALADRFSIVRGYGSGNAGHRYDSVTTAGNSMQASMGAIFSRVAGTNHEKTGMPTNTLVLPEAVQDGLKLGSNFETGALPTLTQPGELGSTHGAFNPSGSGQLKQSMELKIPLERLDDRRNLLAQLDRTKRSVEATEDTSGGKEYRQQAFEMITRGIASAFDLSKEDPHTIAKYDTSGVYRMQDLQRYYDMRRATNLLGRQMLLARRMCEAGCGFVTVSDAGWDMHANNNSPKNMTGMWPMGRQVDHAVAAFIEDVHERGLEDDILLIVTGEMGRTPRINKNGGRDHYGELTPLLLAGGGLKMGQVIGQSDSHATKAVSKSYRPQHLLATVMHTLFNTGELRLQSNLPRQLIKLVEDGKPIGELV